MKFLKIFEDYDSDNEKIDNLIKTERFIEWFGDSQMTDRNGNPIIFYHGSKNDFDVFSEEKIGTGTDNGWLGKGFYFYSSESEASQYGVVKRFFLKIEEPYYATDEENEYLSEMDDAEISEEFSDDLRNNDYDGVYYDGNLRGETVVFKNSQIFNID